MAILDDIRKMMMERASQGIGTGDGIMGNQQQPGLLGGMANINPNLLLGANIISSGIRGVDPFSAFTPALMQTSQTSAVLGEMERQRKSKAFVEKYKKDLPEGSTLKTLFEVNPNKALDFISKQELAKLNAEGKRTTAVKNALAIGLVPDTKEFNDFIRAQTIKTDVAAQALAQQGGQVISPSKRDEIVKDLEFVRKIESQLGNVIQKVTDDETLLGGMGAVRRGANKIGTLLQDLDIDIEPYLPKGLGKDFIFDPDIPTISALENTIAAGYAKVLYPGQKITNQQINQAREIVNLTGFTGSDEVKNRLLQVQREMNNFTTSYQNLLEVDKKKTRLRLNLETGELEEF